MARKTKKYRQAKEVYQELEQLRRSKKKDLPAAFNKLMQITVRLVEERSGLQAGLAVAMDELDGASDADTREAAVRKEFGVGENEALPYWKRVFLEMFPKLGSGSFQTAGQSADTMQLMLAELVRGLVLQSKLDTINMSIRLYDQYLARSSREKRSVRAWQIQSYQTAERELMETLYRAKEMAKMDINSLRKMRVLK